MIEQGKCFSMRYPTLSGPVAVDKERLEAVAMNSVEDKEKQKNE